MKIKIIALVLLLMASAGLLFLLNSGSSQLNAKPFVHSAMDSVNWKKMDHGERKAYMKQIVMPRMKALFAAFDAKHFSNMKCTTCHGPAALDDSYKMPNPLLPKLPNSKEGWGKIIAEKKDMLNFMKDSVKPTMAKLLGMPEFDMKTKTGFGCGNCHTDED